MEKKKLFYGWIVVGVCFLVAAIPMVWLQNFYSYYQMQACEDLGCTYVMYTLGSTGSTIAGILFSLLFASKLAAGKTRYWMMGGGVIAGICIFAIGHVTSIYQLIALFFVANFAFCAVSYIPLNVIISSWFVHRRGQATSMALSGAGVGGMIFTPVVAWILANYSWRMSNKVTGIILIVFTIILPLFLKKPGEMGMSPLMPPATAGQESGEAVPPTPEWEGVTKAQAVKSPSFIFYFITCVCCGMLAAGIVMQLPTFFTENGINYAPAMSIFSGVSIFSMIVMGPIFDKFGLVVGAFITSSMQLLAMILLLLSSSIPNLGFVAVAVLPLGSVVGTLGPPLVASTVFGMKDYGGVYGLGNTGFMVGCMIGPITASSIRVATGSYSIAWILFGCVSVVLCLAMTATIKSKPALIRKYSTAEVE